MVIDAVWWVSKLQPVDAFLLCKMFCFIILIVPSTCNVDQRVQSIHSLADCRRWKNLFAVFAAWIYLCNLCVLKHIFCAVPHLVLGQIEILFASRFCCFLLLAFLVSFFSRSTAILRFCAKQGLSARWRMFNTTLNLRKFVRWDVINSPSADAIEWLRNDGLLDARLFDCVCDSLHFSQASLGVSRF